MSAEHRPSLVMLTSPYEWKILEWEEKQQTNKQTENHARSHLWHCLTSTCRVLNSHLQLRWRLLTGDYKVLILLYLHPHFLMHQAISLTLEQVSGHESLSFIQCIYFLQRITSLKMKQSKSTVVSATCKYNFNIL